MQLVKVDPQGITAVSVRDKPTFAGEKSVRFRVRKQSFDRIIGIDEKTGKPVKAAKLHLVDVDARQKKCGDFVVFTTPGQITTKEDWEFLRDVADQLNHNWITKEQAREACLQAYHVS